MAGIQFHWIYDLGDPGRGEGVHGGDYLAILGGMKTGYRGKKLLSFLHKVHTLFRGVFIVLGMTEYLSYRYKRGGKKAMGSVELTVRQLERFIAKMPNVYLLNNGHVDIDIPTIGPVRVIGSTLWSEPPETLPVSPHAETCAKVYQLSYNGESLSAGRIAELHRAAIKYMSSAISSSHIPVIVLTHTAPTFKAVDPKYGRDSLNQFYATDLEGLIKPPIIGWFHGATNYPYTARIDSVTVASSTTPLLSFCIRSRGAEVRRVRRRV